MKRQFVSIPAVILKTKNGYNAFSPVVDGCVATAKTLDQIIVQYREAIEFHLEGERLVKHKAIRTAKILKEAFADYGTDAVYASIRVSA